MESIRSIEVRVQVDTNKDTYRAGWTGTDARLAVNHVQTFLGHAVGYVPFDKATVRKAISDAYYDARNRGETMEWAADRAVNDVYAALVKLVSA